MATDVAHEQMLSTWGSGTNPSGAARRGDVVLKAGGPWASTVIALLRHLERVGFTGSPRVVGEGLAPDGRLMVSFVPGESAHPRAWADGEVGRIGELLREFHDATATFEVPDDAQWQSTWLHEVHPRGELLIGHGDTAIWNIVGRDGSPEAFVDWEFAGPIDRITELAYTVWLNAQLHDDDLAALQGLPDAVTRARHARSILDGYGLPSHRRQEVVDRMIELAVHAARAEAVQARVTPDSTEAVDENGFPVLWAITWRARSASWMMRHRALLLNPGF